MLIIIIIIITIIIMKIVHKAQNINTTYCFNAE